MSSLPNGPEQQPRPGAKGHRQKGRREQLWEGQGSVTEETRPVCRRGEVKGAAGASTWHGQRGQGAKACPPTSAKAGGAGLAVCQVQPWLHQAPLGVASKTEAPSPLEPGLHPGPGVVGLPALRWVSLGAVLVVPRGPQRLRSQNIFLQLVLPSCFLRSHHNNPPMSLPQVLFSGNLPSQGEAVPRHRADPFPSRNLEKSETWAQSPLSPWPVTPTLGHKGGANHLQREAGLGLGASRVVTGVSAATVAHPLSHHSPQRGWEGGGGALGSTHQKRPPPPSPRTAHVQLDWLDSPSADSDSVSSVSVVKRHRNGVTTPHIPASSRGTVALAPGGIYSRQVGWFWGCGLGLAHCRPLQASAVGWAEGPGQTRQGPHRCHPPWARRGWCSPWW